MVKLATRTSPTNMPIPHAILLRSIWFDSMMSFAQLSIQWPPKPLKKSTRMLRHTVVCRVHGRQPDVLPTPREACTMSKWSMQQFILFEYTLDKHAKSTRFLSMKKSGKISFNQNDKLRNEGCQQTHEFHDSLTLDGNAWLLSWITTFPQLFS